MENKATTWQDLLALAEAANHNNPPEVRTFEPWKTPHNPLIPKGDNAKLTHDDAALLFAEKGADLFKYVPERASWYVWNGHVWVLDKTGENVEFMKMNIRGMVDNVEREWNSVSEEVRKEKKMKKPATAAALNYPFLSGSLKAVATDARVSVPLEAFDANPYELNTPAGVVNLTTGAIREPSSGELVMRTTNVAPAKMDTPLFDNFISQTFAGDEELSTYVQRMLGAALIASQDEQVFMYLHGSGGNGKGTLLTIVQDLIGIGESGYSISVESSMLVDSKYEAHPTEIAQLMGARMVVTSEVPSGAKFDAAKLKKIVGGEYLSGRFMRGDFFSFKPTHTLFVMANDRLTVQHEDRAFWRRLREIPFLFTPVKGEVIKGLAEKLVQEEGPGILQWIIEGAVDYINEGYWIPESVIKANEEYRDAQDTIKYFLNDFCEYQEGTFAAGSEVRFQYERACKQMNATPLSVSAMKAALEANGYKHHRTSSMRGYKDLLLVRGAGF